MYPSREQTLVNICFELVLTARDWEDFNAKSKEELADWVADQLKQCGFPTQPIGMSWGVLIKE